MVQRSSFTTIQNNFVAWLALLGMGLSSGCALFGGGSRTAPHARNYFVTPPKGWTAFHQPESDHAYRLPSGNLATLNSSCERDSRVPLEILTRHLLFGDRNITLVERKKLLVDGGDGLYSLYRTTLDGIPFELALFVTTANNCIFDFSLVSPKAISEGEVGDFLAFVKSFKAHYAKR